MVKRNEVELSLQATIECLYEIVHDLETKYGKAYSDDKHHFTIDGHLLGSIGEVYAAEHYGLELLKSSEKRHDAKTQDGTERYVQIKLTQRKRAALSAGEAPEYLIVLRADKKGRFEEYYNGPGDIVWKQFEGRDRPKNGQFQISLSKLAELNLGVPAEERIPPACSSVAAQRV